MARPGGGPGGPGGPGTGSWTLSELRLGARAPLGRVRRGVRCVTQMLALPPPQWVVLVFCARSAKQSNHRTGRPGALKLDSQIVLETRVGPVQRSKEQETTAVLHR